MIRFRFPGRLLCLVLCLSLLLSGCSALPFAKKKDPATDLRCQEVAERVLACIPEGQEEGASFYWFRLAEANGEEISVGEDLDQEEMGNMLVSLYGIPTADWTDAAVVRMEGARATELAVLKVQEDRQDSVISCWRSYLNDRRGDFFGYEPEQADVVAGARIVSCGSCLALLISEDPDGAEQAFYDCLQADEQVSYGTGMEDLPQQTPASRIPYKDPEIDDMTLYDNSAVLDAWRTGDTFSLSSQGRQILEAAEKVLADIPSDASEVAKEFAVYRWLVMSCTYDYDHYTPSGAPRSSYEPAGPLLEGKGVCLGFATTFQLLMDMLEIPCITVVGASYGNTEDHAWNEVQLDGSWYCVDATWDEAKEPDSPEDCSYFNVSSDWMAGTDHQWDYSAVPEAPARWEGTL